MGMTNRRVAAKKVLDGAKKYASKDVLVVSKGKTGELYLASSMPSGCSQHVEASLKLLDEARKLLQRIHRKLKQQEKAHEEQAAAADG